MSTVMEEFSINATQAGLYMSAFFFGYCITQLPGGIMADKLQPKVIIIVCTILSGFCTAGMGFINGYNAGLILRILTGLASGCIMSSCSKVVTANFEPQKRATGMGILLASPPIGILLANQIAPRLLGVIGWRKTFIVMSLFAVLVVLLVVAFVKPIPKMEGGAQGKKAGLFEGLVAFFTDPMQLVLALSGFMFMFVNNGFSTWCNRYAQSLGLSPTQGGMLVSIFSITGIVASCLSGSIANKLGFSHKKFIMVTLTLFGAMSAVFGVVSGYGLMILVAAVFGIFAYLPSTHYTTSAGMRAGDRFSATAISAQNLIFQLASFVQPVVIGQVIDKTANYTIVWMLFAAICVVGAIIVSFFKAQQVKNA